MVGLMTNSIDTLEYDKMVNLALNLLIDYDMYEFPLKLEKLAKKMNIELKKYSNLDLLTYENLSNTSEAGMTVIEKYNDSHFCFTTWYNDVDDNSHRKRFTVAHEIAHIARGDVGETTENDEKLCDYFAKCLLAPQCLIISKKEFDKNTIVTNYKVSKMVAEYWLQSINKRIATYGEDCLTETEKIYLKKQKKYYNHQPASNGL